MARTKKKEQTPEDIEKLVQEGLNREKQELIKCVERGFIKEPTRHFEIGQRVVWGAHKHVTVIDKTTDGTSYLLHSKYHQEADKTSFQTEKHIDRKHWMAWHDIFPYRLLEDIKNIEQFAQVDDMRLDFFQSTIHSFNSYVYHFGVDMEPEYQRGLVWTLEDKCKLIESIFHNVDIGKFVFIRLDYGNNFLYEILDGKQRLTTIIEFMEDRFAYEGKLFSELHPHDIHKIVGHSISLAEISNPTKKQIYSYFLKLNTSGKPVDQSHLEKVRKLLEKEK